MRKTNTLTHSYTMDLRRVTNEYSVIMVFKHYYLTSNFPSSARAFRHCSFQIICGHIQSHSELYEIRKPFNDAKMSYNNGFYERLFISLMRRIEYKNGKMSLFWSRNIYFQYVCTELFVFTFRLHIYDIYEHIHLFI